MTGDEVIRIAKTLAIFLEQIAKESGTDLDDSEITIKADGKVIKAINAGVTVAAAKALQYGCIDDDDE